MQKLIDFTFWCFVVLNSVSGPVKMHRDCRDIAGCTVKDGFGRAFVKDSNVLFDLANPISEPLILKIAPGTFPRVSQCAFPFILVRHPQA